MSNFCNNLSQIFAIFGNNLIRFLYRGSLSKYCQLGNNLSQIFPIFGNNLTQSFRDNLIILDYRLLNHEGSLKSIQRAPSSGTCPQQRECSGRNEDLCSDNTDEVYMHDRKILKGCRGDSQVSITSKP